MWAMILGLIMGILMMGCIAFLIAMEFVPGLIVRFIIKRRPLTKPERKKFRVVLEIIMMSLTVILCVIAVLLADEETVPAKIVAQFMLCTLPYTAQMVIINSLITKIRSKKNRT